MMTRVSSEEPQPKRLKQEQDDDDNETEEIEQGLMKLVEHRIAKVKEAEAQLAKCQKQLVEAQAKLARVQNRRANGSKLSSATPPTTSAKVAVSAKTPTDLGTNHRESGASENVKQHKTTKSSNVIPEARSSVEKATPKKPRVIVRKEHVELISQVRSSATPTRITAYQPTYISSQHKRKLRSLCVNPTTEQICATSALDGTVNMWHIQGKGIGLSLLSTSECLSPGQRRWPEDMTWDPSGDSLFACYSADGKDNQVAIISSSKKKVTFLVDKPHIKGIINNINFMPWAEECVFATGGSDHAVVLWREEESGWKPKALHRSLHSSAVMGVAGMYQKQMVLSVGADKRVVGYETRYGRADFKYQLESKAMGVLPNPADFNLFMVQVGTPEQQLRLFDIRVKQSECHVFGWAQETSESQSALINQTWSPDGLYIASGSADPKIHVYDIRYNSKGPAQSIRAHTKRVFTAAWHHSLPLIISISSDLNIGLHRIAQ